MDPEVQKALLKLVEEAKDVAAQEIPLVLQDLLIKGVVDNSVMLIVGMLSIPILWLLFRHMRNVNALPDDGYANDKGFKQVITGVGIGITGVVTLLMIGGSVSTLLTIWLAPRAYLLGLLK